MAKQLPIYEVIKRHIVDQISSGVWPEEYRTPSENALVAEFSVSRMTVNRALRELTDEGWLYRVQGLGTFVKKRKVQSELFEIKNIAAEIRERGGDYSCDIKLLAAHGVEGTIAQMMGVAEGAEVFHSIIIHKENGIPIQLADRYVNPELVPGYLEVDFMDMTPNEYLSLIAPLGKVEHILEVIMPDLETQKSLNITAFEPCLLLNRRTWSQDQIISYALLTHPGSRYKMGVNFKT